MAQTPPVAVAGPLHHACLKAALFALLACNAALYLASGTLSEALDSVAWLALITLYELETGSGLLARGRWTGSAVRGVRLLAAAAIVAAAAGYARDREWLDAVNAGLWIAIVVMFEWQVRFPVVAARQRTSFTAAVSLVYGALGLLVAVWIWRGDWFEAYDALLWLAALVVIEMNILRRISTIRV